MSNKVVRFPATQPEQDAILEQACMWLSRLDAAEGQSEELNEQVRSWLEERPEHVTALLDTARLWDQMGALSELSEIFPLDQKTIEPGRSYGAMALMAASVALLVVAVTFGLANFNTESMPIELQANYSTQVGEQSEVALPDGSEIILNTNTLLEVDYQEGVRNIYLSHGEALFNVASDTSRPFRVHAGSRIIEAVGTAFTVQRLQDNQVEVLVTEGEVKLSSIPQPDVSAEQPDLPAETSLSMIAGDYYAEFDTDQLQLEPVMKLDTGDLQARLYWQHGVLYFEQEPLIDVLAEIGRYTTFQFEVDPEIQNLDVSLLWQQVSDIDGFLTALSNFDIDVQRRGEDRIYLAPL